RLELVDFGSVKRAVEAEPKSERRAPGGYRGVLGRMLHELGGEQVDAAAARDFQRAGRGIELVGADHHSDPLADRAVTGQLGERGDFAGAVADGCVDEGGD